METVLAFRKKRPSAGVFLYAIVLPCFALQVSVVAGIFLFLGDMSVTGIGCTYDPAGFVLLALFALIAIAVFSALLLLLLKVNSSKTSRYREDNPRRSYRRIAGVLLFLLMAGVSHSSTTAPEHREGIILPQKSWLEETAIPVYLSIFDSRTGRITLLLINLATFGVMRRKLCLKSDTPEAALELLATRRPFTVRTLVAMLWLFPYGPPYWRQYTIIVYRKSDCCAATIPAPTVWEGKYTPCPCLLEMRVCHCSLTENGSNSN